MGQAELDFSALYSRHLDFVWRSLRAMGVPGADLEDATQDTFVVAYRRRLDYRHDASMRGWLYGIARRVAYRHRRSGGRRTRLTAAYSVEPRPAQSLEVAAQDRQAWETAMTLLDRLPGPQREAYWLTEVEGMTAAEAGAAVGASGNTISSRLRAARHSLARSGAAMQAREAGELQRALRRGAQPSQRQRASVLAALAAKSPAAAAAVPLVGSWTVGAVAVAVAAVVGIRMSGEPESASRPARLPVVSVAAALEPEASPPRAAPITAATPVAVRAPEPRSAEPVRRGARPPAPSRGTLAEEAALVRSIKATADVDPAGALKLVRTHARRFPAGVLSHEAAALKVRALCDLGRHAEAKAAAEDLPPGHVWAAGCRGSGTKDNATNLASSGEEKGT